MDKQEILNEIEKTKEHLAKMMRMLQESKNQRYKPKEHELFWYLDTWNRPCVRNYIDTSVCCNESFKNYNCFQTKQEAEAEAEKILVRRMLEDIARRLNKGQKIDWGNGNQYKYCLAYSTDYQHIIIQDHNINVIRQGMVYCLDGTFRSVAIREIGEERLKAYLRGK